MGNWLLEAITVKNGKVTKSKKVIRASTLTVAGERAQKTFPKAAELRVSPTNAAVSSKETVKTYGTENNDKPKKKNPFMKKKENPFLKKKKNPFMK